MQRKSIFRKNGGFYGQTIFNIACYNLSRNYAMGGKNTKKVIAQCMAIMDYIEKVKAPKEDLWK